MVLSIAMLASVGTSVMADDVEGNTALEVLRDELTEQYSSTFEQEAINLTIDNFANDEMYLAHYHANPAQAINNVRMNALKEIEVSAQPYWYFDGVYGASAPVIKQKTSSYCGPASTLQCLYALGRSSSVSGSTDDQKQDTLANDIGAGSIVYKISDTLNKYSYANYTYASASSMSIDSFKSYILFSLRADAPAILHAETDALGYYNGHLSYHYIVVKGYNPQTQKLVLADCNYTAAYRGEFTVSVQEAYNSLKGNRYLIYGG